MFNDLIYRLYPMMDEDGGAEGGAGTAPEPAGGNDDPEPMTFDEWLASNPEFQKEFDRRTTKGINTAVTKERARRNKLHDDQLTEAVKKVFDFRPAAIIRDLDLRRPIYRQTAAYGHFGRLDVDLPWEHEDRTEALKAAIQ